ncbi:MAG: electron transport complex subunit RsxE [Christensenellales bacterium]|nr:electron transport complex subunit E [Clostridiales bacterium]MDY4199007.1 electron transport complex subunit E [Candidatus Fimadaptatus sp.]
MKKLKGIVFNGIVTENPTFRLVLGMCPTLAITTTVSNGLGMGLAATFVLICSNLVISLLRNFIPDKIRIPAFIVVIATFVTIVQLLLQAFIPALYESLGVFIPLIVVNCIIFARAESFASKNPPLESACDGLGMGLGFTLAITLLSAIRELLGSGTLLGIQVMPDGYQPMAIITQAPGGFIMLGLLMVVMNSLFKAYDRRRASKEG